MIECAFNLESLYYQEFECPVRVSSDDDDV